MRPYRRSLLCIVAFVAGVPFCTLQSCAPRPTQIARPPPDTPVTVRVPHRPIPIPKVAPAPTLPVEEEEKGGEDDFIVAQSDEFVIVTARESHSLTSLAERFLGDSGLAWMIADFNGVRQVLPGQEIVIPLSHPNPVGVYADGYQTVPILCYHRFGGREHKMVVSPESFAAQMAYLVDNGFRVVPLTDFAAFLRGEKALPERSVVITIDDGYKSAYEIAYPVLKKHRFPATIFLYTDFVDARAGLSWDEIREMAESGLVDIQPHSKSHSNISFREVGETEESYRQRISTEVLSPRQEIHEELGLPMHTFAYPYGDANEYVIERLGASDYRQAVTVYSGGNPAFSFPYLLRRTMIFGQDDLAEFRKKLEVFQTTK